eukprot:m.361875 g.361875  ORF g.361875 m.361875 type:complete len:370 (+) comp19954_c0_seq1:71-1180(+)
MHTKSSLTATTNSRGCRQCFINGALSLSPRVGLLYGLELPHLLSSYPFISPHSSQFLHLSPRMFCFVFGFFGAMNFLGWLFVGLFLLKGGAASPLPHETGSRWVSYWYSVDNTVNTMLTTVKAHQAAVTSVILDCGHELLANLTVGAPKNQTQCQQAADGLRELGVKVEIACGLENNSIKILRDVSQNWIAFPGMMQTLAETFNASGINLDFEPQTPGGSASDAPPFAALLNLTRTALNTINVRLTVDVADWSPVLNQYELLAPCVDRLLDMETYNQASWDQWYGYYKNIVKPSVPREQVGIGIFPFAQQNGTWPSTPASVTQRINQIAGDNVPEIFVFRILTSQSPPWPWTMWWQPLQDFLAGPPSLN